MDISISYRGGIYLKCILERVESNTMDQKERALRVRGK